jgi:uncharacterized protein YprB with RNaseH-like and TPR domain
VATTRHGEIAELLRRKLEELRARDESVTAARRDRWSPRPAIVAPTDAQPGFLEMRDRLVRTHRGVPLATILGGRKVDGSGLLEVTSAEPGRKIAWSPGSSGTAMRDRLSGALWMLPGVREATAARLARDGYGTVHALADHPRHRPRARRLARQIDRMDAADLMETLAARAGRGHPLCLALARLFDPSDLLFLDIETMGLFGGSPIVVAGLGKLSDAGIEVRLLVAPSPGAEESLVSLTAAALESHAALVTFNGRMFDLPYVSGRAAFYGSPLGAEPVHFDLLPFSRRAYAGKVPDCRLSTLSHHVLGLSRDGDIPGGWVPAFYQHYLEDPDRRAGLVAAVAAHNRADVVEMIRLFEVLLGWAG